MKLYILKCTKNRWYIGRTERDVVDRLEEHMIGKGCEWTKLYKPVKLTTSFDIQDPLDEDLHVKKYMKQYGIQNVRGGSYSSVELPEYQLMTLEDELNGAGDKCFRCGRKGHFVNSCYATTKATGEVIDDDVVWVCEFCGAEFDSEQEACKHEALCDSQKLSEEASKDDAEWVMKQVANCDAYYCKIKYNSALPIGYMLTPQQINEFEARTRALNDMICAMGMGDIIKGIYASNSRFPTIVLRFSVKNICNIRKIEAKIMAMKLCEVLETGVTEEYIAKRK